jgi:hypothetical protein
LKQSELDWFRPLWRRVAVTAFVAAWFAWETIFNQDQLWMAITGAALAYAVWTFFIRFDQRAGKSGDDDGKPKS